MEQPWIEFYEEELKFQQETDELGDIPEAEASYYSVYGYLPGAFHFGQCRMQEPDIGWFKGALNTFWALMGMLNRRIRQRAR